MADDNKPLKYMRYAIGEIVLVVIGILIALQINTWNEERKTRINERELYSRIIIDLQVDEKRLIENIKYYKDDQSMYYKIYQDSKGLWANDSLIDFSTFRAGRIFNLIIEDNYSKYIEEISKDSFREKVNYYFKQEDHVDDAIKSLWDFKETILKLFLSKYGINNTNELFNNYKLDYYELREENILSYSKLKEQYGTVVLDQLLFDLGIKTSWAISAHESLLTTNKKLQLDLKNELNGIRSIPEK